jgi:Flp pilus assembly protein TadD
MDLLKPSAYIMKNDFNSALVSVNKQLAKNPKSWEALAIRANIYKNLGYQNMATVDYNEALSLCQNEKSRNLVNEYYQNKSAVNDERNAMRKQFQDMGGIL